MVNTENYFKKKIIKTFFNEENYHKIKFLKILLDYKIGKPYNEIIKFLPGLINGKGTILDVGANMGQYLCRLSKYFPNSTIISFEPIHVNFLCLKKMKKILGLKNAEIYELAVSDKNGTDTMVTPYIKEVPITTQSGLIDSVKYSIEKDKKFQKNEVHTTTIDDIVFSNNMSNIILIKVDTEGAENKVLRGALQTILRYKPLLILETSIEDTEVRKLIEIGYNAYYFSNKILIPYFNGNPNGDIILKYEH